jgi:exodeoxyribonuclease VII large subunit
LDAGIKLLVYARPVFKPEYGFSLDIVDIDPNYTLGDMEARLKHIRERLKTEGLAQRNKQLTTPADFAHVAVISPADAVGKGDFQAEAARLEAASLCRFTYVDAVFQGEKAKESLRRLASFERRSNKPQWKYSSATGQFAYKRKQHERYQWL